MRMRFIQKFDISKLLIYHKIMSKMKSANVTKIGLLYVVGWVIAIITLIVGLGSATTAPTASILAIVAAIIINPTTWDISRKKFRFELSGFLRFIMYVILMLVALGLSA